MMKERKKDPSRARALLSNGGRTVQVEHQVIRSHCVSGRPRLTRVGANRSRSGFGSLQQGLWFEFGFDVDFEFVVCVSIHSASRASLSCRVILSLTL